MTVYDFAGIADGQPWPSPWSGGGFYTGTGIRDVQTEKGCLRAIRGAFGLAAQGWEWIAIAHADVDFAAAISMTETSTEENYQALMGARSATPSGTWDWPASGYFLEMRYDSTGLVRLVKRVASATTVLDTLDPGDFADGADWIFRLKVLTVGSTVEVRAKVWHEADQEPDWNLTYDDTAANRITAAGVCALGAMLPNGLNESEYLDLRLREAEIVNASTFNYTAPTLTATLDDTDYSADLSWTGSASDNYQIERQVWLGAGEPWL